MCLGEIFRRFIWCCLQVFACQSLYDNTTHNHHMRQPKQKPKANEPLAYSFVILLFEKETKKQRAIRLA